jgi:hypothetical protein
MIKGWIDMDVLSDKAKACVAVMARALAQTRTLLLQEHTYGVTMNPRDEKKLSQAESMSASLIVAEAAFNECIQPASISGVIKSGIVEGQKFR